MGDEEIGEASEDVTSEAGLTDKQGSQETFLARRTPHAKAERRETAMCRLE